MGGFTNTRPTLLQKPVARKAIEKQMIKLTGYTERSK